MQFYIFGRYSVSIIFLKLPMCQYILSWHTTEQQPIKMQIYSFKMKMKLVWNHAAIFFSLHCLQAPIIQTVHINSFEAGLPYMWKKSCYNFRLIRQRFANSAAVIGEYCCYDMRIMMSWLVKILLWYSINVVTIGKQCCFERRRIFRWSSKEALAVWLAKNTAMIG
jgi:hypothetical protein